MYLQVLSDKQQIVHLDRRRNKTREALRCLTKDKESDKAWVCMRDMFMKLPKKNTATFLKKDYEQLDTEISELQRNLKPKVSKLRDLEDKDDLKGFNLNPLSKEELSNIMEMT